jgi:hypothetical protein
LQFGFDLENLGGGVGSALGVAHEGDGYKQAEERPQKHPPAARATNGAEVHIKSRSIQDCKKLPQIGA